MRNSNFLTVLFALLLVGSLFTACDKSSDAELNVTDEALTLDQLEGVYVLKDFFVHPKGIKADLKVNFQTKLGIATLVDVPAWEKDIKSGDVVFTDIKMQEGRIVAKYNQVKNEKSAAVIVIVIGTCFEIDEDGNYWVYFETFGRGRIIIKGALETNANQLIQCPPLVLGQP